MGMYTKYSTVTFSWTCMKIPVDLLFHVPAHCEIDGLFQRNPNSNRHTTQYSNLYIFGYNKC